MDKDQTTTPRTPCPTLSDECVGSLATKLAHAFIMAGRVTTISVYFGLLLCLFLILNGIKQDKTLMKRLSNSSNLYFASQEARRVDIQSFHTLARRPAKHQAVGAFKKRFITCKLLFHASLALARIALAGDVELNPGYRSLEDVRSSRGLKIAHLNIRSLRNKSDLLSLQGLDNTTIDILTFSETWLRWLLWRFSCYYSRIQLNSPE